MSFLWFLSDFRTPFLDKLMQFITYFGQELIVIAVICALYWCVDKRFAYLLGFTYFTAGLCVQALKITFRIPRPWILDPNFHAVKSALPGATGYSFPSGHTQSATALFFPLALRAKKKVFKLLFVLMFLLIGFSRMYLGCHTPKDVFVSMGITLLVSLGLWHFQDFILNDTEHLKLIAIVLSVFSVFVAVYALILNNSGIIEAKYAIDCSKAAGAGLAFSAGWYLERTRLNFDTYEKNKKRQFFKLFIGLLIALGLKKGFSFAFGSSVLAKMSEYFILVLWVLIIYPFLFTKIKRRTS